MRVLFVFCVALFGSLVFSGQSLADDSELLSIIESEKTVRQIQQTIRERVARNLQSGSAPIRANPWTTIYVKMTRGGELLDARLGSTSLSNDPSDLAALSAVIKSFPFYSVGDLDSATFNHHFGNFKIQILSDGNVKKIEFGDREPEQRAKIGMAERRRAINAHASIKKRIEHRLLQAGDAFEYPRVTVRMRLKRDGSLLEIGTKSLSTDNVAEQKLVNAIISAVPFSEVSLLDDKTFSEQFANLTLTFGSDNPYPLNAILGEIRTKIIRAWRRPVGELGGATVFFRISLDREGRVVALKIQESEGSPAFQRSAIRAVYDSAPFSVVKFATDKQYNETLNSFTIKFQPQK